ncbi:MAG: AAA family ATPase [Planctomycetales bacterium]|nr:AAA family ATPase [Planctomycetales bacterium]
MTPQRYEQHSESGIDEFRAALAERIGVDRYELWFERFQSPRLEEGQLVVSASDSYTLSSISRLFERTLHELLTQTGLAAERIRFRVEATVAGASAQPSTPTASTDSTRSAKPTDPRRAAGSGLRISAESAEPVERPLPLLSDVVTGPHNQMAVVAAQQVAHQPGTCSPLYIYGPTGSGKSWLLRSIAHSIFRQRAHRCLSISAEQFVTGYIEALQGSGMPSFRAKHRDVDVLLIDDVHFVAGKRATIGELINTIDRLCDTGRQVIVTSTRPPAELTELGPDLSARLGAGLVCSIDFPQGDAKRQLIERLAASKGLKIPAPIVDMMADELAGDARQLSGAVHRLIGLKLAGAEVTSVDEARRQLEDLVPIAAACVGMSEIEDAVCETFGINRELLRSSSKSRQCSQPRMLAMWLARRMTRAALSEIGDYFGGRRHSTVATAQRTVDGWLKNDRVVGTMHRSLRVTDAVRRIERRLACG